MDAFTDNLEAGEGDAFLNVERKMPATGESTMRFLKTVNTDFSAQSVPFRLFS
jgi:hypothetical protein